jgi:adenosylcobinamide-GDP ribazoletransferase
LMQGLVAAIRLLTILRVPQGEHDPLALAGSSVAWFAFVGLLVGAIAGLVGWGIEEAGAPLVAAAAMVIADLVLTGMLHVDGLIDSADGLLGARAPEWRLEAMADPRAGSFGVATACSVLILRFSALASIRSGWHLVPLLAGITCLGRVVMVMMMATMQAARQEGMAYFLAPAARRPRAIVASIIATAIAGALLVLSAQGVYRWEALGKALGSIATFSVATVGVAMFAQRRINGITGDILGATCAVAEAVGLVAYALI